VSRRQLVRRTGWLIGVVREIPGLAVETSAPDRLRLAFDGHARAELFRRALVAENMPAELDESRVELRLEPWYSPADLLGVARAITKVAHYLRAGLS
jgi:hypothetical protein